MPSTKVYLSTLGRPVDPGDARISVFDRGFLYGDSVYETLRTAGARVVEFERHLARLHHSARGIGLDIPFADAEIRAAVAATHVETGNDDSSIRIIVTRGTGPVALDPRTSEGATLVVLVQPLTLPPPELYERGIAVVVVTVDKGGGGLDPSIKTGNYLSNIQALRQAIAQGADDAILCNRRGEVSEGSTSNVFIVQGERLRTPDIGAGLLAGITREVLVELAQAARIPVDEGALRPEDLYAADEVFLTSSVRGIMPVTRIGGQPVGTGRVGPVTERLRRLYAQALTAGS